MDVGSECGKVGCWWFVERVPAIAFGSVKMVNGKWGCEMVGPFSPQAWKGLWRLLVTQRCKGAHAIVHCSEKKCIFVCDDDDGDDGGTKSNKFPHSEERHQRTLAGELGGTPDLVGGEMSRVHARPDTCNRVLLEQLTRSGCLHPQCCNAHPSGSAFLELTPSVY